MAVEPLTLTVTAGQDDAGVQLLGPITTWNINNTSSPGIVYQQQITNQLNTPITVPSNTTIVIIMPDPAIPPQLGSGPIYQLKGINGDTGITVKGSLPAIFPVGGLSSFVIFTSVGINAYFTFIFL